MHTSEKPPAFSRPPEFFAGIGKAHLLEVLGAAQRRRLGAQRIILREGHAPDHLFLLTSGRAKFYRLTPRGEEVLFADIAPGDVFGLGTLLSDPVPYIGTAETTKESEVMAWEQSRIRALARKHPRLAQNALAIVLRYLAGHFDRLFDLLTCTAAERVARVLLHVGKRFGVVAPNGIEIVVSNADLAAMANVSAFTVSRLVATWTRTGALTKSRGKIFVRNPEKLITA